MTSAKKSCLRKFFNAAARIAIGASVIAGAVFAGFTISEDMRYPVSETAPLTENEAALVRSIFGKEIETAAVRKELTLIENKSTAAMTFNKRVKFYGSIIYSADFAAEKNIFKYGVFTHEMTHIWQSQNKGQQSVKGMAKTFLEPFRYDGGEVYRYLLSPKSRFEDFGAEQQASIIEDYTRRFLHSSHGSSRHPPAGYDTSKNDVLLQGVIESRFPEARKTRLTLEAKEKSTAQKTFQAPGFSS